MADGDRRRRRSTGRPAPAVRRTAERPSLVVAVAASVLAVAALSVTGGGVVVPPAASGGGPLDADAGFQIATASEAPDDGEGYAAGGARSSAATGAGQPGDGPDEAGATRTVAPNRPAGPSDADPYPAAMEADCPARLPDADPQVQDVYVEVDTTGDVTLDAGTVARLEAAFADAPVTNPGGETGMRLHLVRSDVGLPERGPVDNRPGPGAYDDVWDYRESHFDNAGAGYYYLLLTAEAAYRGDAAYAGAGTNGTVVAQSYDSDAITASLLLHELGHAFGMSHALEGVDDRSYDRTEYESVMNYNALYDLETYSDGDDAVGRDEWAFVAEDRHRPAVTVPDGATCPGGDRTGRPN